MTPAQWETGRALGLGTRAGLPSVPGSPGHGHKRAWVKAERRGVGRARLLGSLAGEEGVPGGRDSSYLVSQYVDVVPHVPGGGSVLPILSILKLHLPLQVGLLDHLHLQEGRDQSSCVQGDPRGPARAARTPRDPSSSSSALSYQVSTQPRAATHPPPPTREVHARAPPAPGDAPWPVHALRISTCPPLYKGTAAAEGTPLAKTRHK